MITKYTAPELKKEIESYLKIIDMLGLFLPAEKFKSIKKWADKISKVATQELALELLVFILNVFDKDDVQTVEAKEAINFFFVQKQATGVAPTQI